MPSNLSFSQTERCLCILHAELWRSWRCPRSGAHGGDDACEVSLALWGFEVGAVASATPVCE